ncbi:MAG: hypothetical protein ACJAVI_001406 [Candidatus Azotimanducaceae bacterium]|jgi:hypothetical protein
MTDVFMTGQCHTRKTGMRAFCLLLTLSIFGAFGSAQAADETEKEQEKKKQDWKVFTQLNLFAYSAPVSIDKFANNFDAPLESGDTAFTHNQIEAGVQWNEWRVSYVQRFDYVTSFTEDTALYHHSVKNNIPLATNREYQLLLDVERLTASGLKLGYTWDVRDDLSFDIAFAYYNELSGLQSGKAAIDGDLEPITDQLIADAEAILDGVDAGNRDLSPLLTLVQDVNAKLLIDYYYDDPKFNEPIYAKPVVTGPPNPVISGVDFSEPNGSGYSLDLGVNWQVTEQLNLDLKLFDVVNNFSWENAPYTLATFDLNSTLIDAIGVSQDFVNGLIVTPNDIIDRQLGVTIINQDYDQELPWRANLRASYSLDKELNVFNFWTPNISVLGGYYYTKTQHFPSLGIGFDDTFQLAYDFGGEAFSVNYRSKYLFARLLTDSLSFQDAHTIGFSVGFNFGF